MDAQCRKAYVSVNVDIDEEGAVQPRAIRWRGGRSYRIDRVLYKCRAASQKVDTANIPTSVLMKTRSRSPTRTYGTT